MYPFVCQYHHLNCSLSSFLSSLQIKRKLPKVNSVLAARILEDEEAENETKGADGDDIKKKSKKKKSLSSDVFKDE